MFMFHWRFLAEATGEVTKPSFVAAALVLTDNTSVTRGGVSEGGWMSLWEPESCWGVLLAAESEEGEVWWEGFCFLCASPKVRHRCNGLGYLLLWFPHEELKTGNAAHWKCLDMKLDRFLFGHCMFIFTRYLYLKNWHRGCFCKDTEWIHFS